MLLDPNSVVFRRWLLYWRGEDVPWQQPSGGGGQWGGTGQGRGAGEGRGADRGAGEACQGAECWAWWGSPGQWRALPGHPAPAEEEQSSGGFPVESTGAVASLVLVV